LKPNLEVKDQKPKTKDHPFQVVNGVDFDVTKSTPDCRLRTRELAVGISGSGQTQKNQKERSWEGGKRSDTNQNQQGPERAPFPTALFSDTYYRSSH